MFGGYGRGYRHWWRATGLPGWVRARMGLPAWGKCCWAPGFFGAPSKEEEVKFLKEQAEGLKELLAEIEKRLAELEKKE